jgi:hypothetical protein
VIAACSSTAVVARSVHPTKTAVTPSPTASASPDATPTPTPSPPADTPAAEPVESAPPAPPAATPPPGPAACAASATGTLSISAVYTANGDATLWYKVDVGCTVTVLLASNYGLHHSFTCPVAECAGVDADSPPAAGGATTMKGTPYGPPTPIPLSPTPSPTH